MQINKELIEIVMLQGETMAFDNTILNKYFRLRAHKTSFNKFLYGSFFITSHALHMLHVARTTKKNTYLNKLGKSQISV